MPGRSSSISGLAHGHLSKEQKAKTKKSACQGKEKPWFLLLSPAVLNLQREPKSCIHNGTQSCLYCHSTWEDWTRPFTFCQEKFLINFYNVVFIHGFLNSEQESLGPTAVLAKLASRDGNFSESLSLDTAGFCSTSNSLTVLQTACYFLWPWKGRLKSCLHCKIFNDVTSKELLVFWHLCPSCDWF